MTSASDEKLRPFSCFFSRVGLRTYQHPCIMASNRWKSIAARSGAVWLVGKNRPSKFCDSFVWYQACVVVRCRAQGGFHQNFCVAELSLNSSARFEESECTLSELMVWSCGLMSTKVTPCGDHYFPRWRCNLKLLLPMRSRLTPFQWMRFCLR